jgi:topoisomerase-4 subunit A
LVFEPKTKNIDEAEFANFLLAHTSLESNASINLVMIGTDGRPRQKGILSIVQEWAQFRIETVTRRTQHRLGKVNDRMHILEGRQLVLLNIDKVIQIIRNSDEPKVDLMSAFKLSDRQAEDILEIRLRQLARLEAIKIEQEITELKAERDDLESLLGSDSMMRKKIIKEVEADAKTFGDDRRTLIQEEKRSVVQTKIIDEPLTVIVSQKGWVRSRLGHGHDPSQFAFKAGDALFSIYECRTIDVMIGIGSNGRAYSVPVADLPGARGDGTPYTSLINIEPGTQMISYYAGAGDDLLFIAMASGNGFLANVSDMLTRNKAGKSFVGVNEEFEGGDHVLPLQVVREGMTMVACLSANGRLLTFELADLKRLQAGGKGVILMDLEAKESLQSAIAFGNQGLQMEGLGRAGKATAVNISYKTLMDFKAQRARKGHAIEPKLKEARLLQN